MLFSTSFWKSKFAYALIKKSRVIILPVELNLQTFVMIQHKI